MQNTVLIINGHYDFFKYCVFLLFCGENLLEFYLNKKYLYIYNLKMANIFLSINLKFFHFLFKNFANLQVKFFLQNHMC